MPENTITNSIPVVYKHLHHLEGAVDCILQQTLLPSEIIIIISEYNENENSCSLLKEIDTKIKDKNIKSVIRTYNNKQYAGQNRQIAYNLCTSNIIIFQDCDDLTHKQRNEIFLKIHKKTKSPHILHGYTGDINAQYKNIDMDNIKISHKINNSSTANGPIFIKKSIYGNIKFPNHKIGEDVTLNNKLFRLNKALFRLNTVLIENRDIYIYRADLSSWK